VSQLTNEEVVTGDCQTEGSENRASILSTGYQKRRGGDTEQERNNVRKQSRLFNKEVLRMKSLSIRKRVAFAAIAAAALAGPVTSAQALTINTGDLLLEVYGNNTEYTKDLGNMTSVLNTGIDLDLNSILGTVGGANTIKYTLVAATGSAITDTVLFGDQSPRAPWTSLQLTTLNPANIQNGVINWETTKLNG